MEKKMRIRIASLLICLASYSLRAMEIAQTDNQGDLEITINLVEELKKNSAVTLEDVLALLNKAKNEPNTAMKSLASAVEKLTVTDGLKALILKMLNDNFLDVSKKGAAAICHNSTTKIDPKVVIGEIYNSSANLIKIHHKGKTETFYPSLRLGSLDQEVHPGNIECPLIIEVIDHAEPHHPENSLLKAWLGIDDANYLTLTTQAGDIVAKSEKQYDADKSHNLALFADGRVAFWNHN